MQRVSFTSRATRRSVVGITSALVGVAIAAVVAGPASASPPPDTPSSTSPSSTPPALTDWLAQSSTASTPAAANRPSTATVFVKPAVIVGKRTTFTRGGAPAWVSDTFEWYWSGGSITSSTGWQADGYIFPNNVTLRGVKRTLAIPTQHNWRGTATLGAGVVTPWGAVDVYQLTTTDYFSLTPGGGFSHSS